MHYDSDILIVDDTPEHIRIAGTILLKQGYHIRVATSGKDCLDMVKAKPPSMILLDIQMPGMDGFEVCRRLKSNPASKDIPVIFVTADINRESLQTGFLLGAQDYIMKPYHASELIARVNAQVRLYQQSLELKTAYDELNQFCHSVSHDLKAPVQVIKQLAALLGEEINNGALKKPEAITKEDAAEITASLNSILSMLDTKCSQTITMIERLLEFSKMTEKACHYESVDLAQLVYAVFRDLSALEDGRDIKLICGQLPYLSADATLISLLIQNILGNSIKFTSTRKEAVIEVSSKVLENHVEISFSDNGVGFDMEYADRLFKVFERLHTQEEFEGSGVGLAIVRRIMIKHGGDVSIFSVKDEGTTVKLSFPLYRLLTAC